MSHFSTIRTKLKNKETLLEALNLLQCNVKEKQDLVIENPSHAEDHPVMNACIGVAPDIGFCWNEQTQSYDLYSCLLYTSPSPRDVEESRMPSSA